MALFFASLTQARVGLAGPTGLDYQGVRAAADMLGMTMTPELFQGLQTAESEWLAVLAEASKKT